jgi:hypothetical protein
LDYEKTISLYEKYNLRKAWEQLPENADYNQEVKWFETVKSKRSGEYWQADELRNRELVSADWEPPHKDQKGKPLRYPLKTVNIIYRRRRR